VSQFNKYQPSENLKFNNLGIFQGLKLHDSMRKILRISLELNFTSNTFGCCYGFNPLQPKVFWVKFSLREIGRIFFTKIRNFKPFKMPKSKNLRFLEGWYFFNWDNTELKRSSKIFFSVAERHRWAVKG